MDNDEKISQVRDALEAAGLHTWEIAEGIVNVHSAPNPQVGTEPEVETYLYTVTITTTP